MSRHHGGRIEVFPASTKFVEKVAVALVGGAYAGGDVAGGGESGPPEFEGSAVVGWPDGPPHGNPSKLNELGNALVVGEEVELEPFGETSLENEIGEEPTRAIEKKELLGEG